MPTHWESSKRPLFVRTVFVNGNRHAILSQEDPLCQSNAAPSSRKQSRPSSCQSFSSTYSVNSFGSRDSNFGKRFRNFKTDDNNNNQWEQENRVNNSNSKGDISSELQGCLVKLRLVLATHENKNKCKNERSEKGNQNDRKCNQSNRQKENVKQKRKKSNHPKTNKKKNCDYYFYSDPRNEALKEIDLKDYKEDSNYYSFANKNEDQNYYYLETTSKLSSSSLNYCCEKDANLIEIRDICCFEGYHETRKENESILSRTSTTITSFVEKVERNHGNPPSQFFPTIQLPSNDISWNSLSSDSYFTRPFYNPLSERVLQWLDLASKRKESNMKSEKLNEEISTDAVERIFEGKTFLDENNMARYRDKTRTKKSKISRSKSEGKSTKNTNNYDKKDRKREFLRQSVEKKSDSKESDAEDEVKQENDVETALSNQIIPQDYPKYSTELNKLHKSMSQTDKNDESSATSSEAEKLSTGTDSTSSGIVLSDKIDSESSTSSIIIIPEKLSDESAVSLNLQESIMNSFNDAVRLKANKNEIDKNKSEQTNYSFTTYQYFPQAKPKAYQTIEERRGQLTRQAKLQETSDEDEDGNLKNRKIDCWNKTIISVKQRRSAFSHRNSMFNKTIDCNSSRTRRDALKRQKNRSPSLQQKDKDDTDSSPSENQSIIQAIFHQNPLPPQLQNKIPWLRDYQTGGRNMWPSDKGTNKPQLHIFMPAIPPKMERSGTGDDSISDCESLTSEVCPCNENCKIPEEA